ncbi:MAG: hypothetical protein J6A43_04610 [Clostridia bacterium]|nr:hypothetical protein [Clostridia bacterium]MBO5433321.1 hypothetical protein [Clostridia bacterium]
MEEKNVNAVENTAENKKQSKDNEFQFFKCCSASLKKFSLIMFVVNIFLILVVAVIGIFVCIAYVSVEMISILAFPIFCIVAILIIIARFISALIYGFAEIVEKHENK